MEQALAQMIVKKHWAFPLTKEETLFLKECHQATISLLEENLYQPQQRQVLYETMLLVISGMESQLRSSASQDRFLINHYFLALTEFRSLERQLGIIPVTPFRKVLTAQKK